MACRALRSAPLRRTHRLRVSERQARLRTVPDRGAHQPEHLDLAAALALEPDGFAGDPRKPACDPDRRLDPVRFAALPASGNRANTRAEAGDRVLWRSDRNGGKPRRRPCRAFRAAPCCTRAREQLGPRAGWRPRRRSPEPLYARPRTLEGRRLERLRRRTRDDADAAGGGRRQGAEPAIESGMRMRGKAASRGASLAPETRTGIRSSRSDPSLRTGLISLMLTDLGAVRQRRAAAASSKRGGTGVAQAAFF